MPGKGVGLPSNEQGCPDRGNEGQGSSQVLGDSSHCDRERKCRCAFVRGTAVGSAFGQRQLTVVLTGKGGTTAWRFSDGCSVCACATECYVHTACMLPAQKRYSFPKFNVHEIKIT